VGVSPPYGHSLSLGQGDAKHHHIPQRLMGLAPLGLCFNLIFDEKLLLIDKSIGGLFLPVKGYLGDIMVLF
jgi:hypothetical protein